MEARKRVEIVVDALDAERVIEVLERLDLDYTRIRDVSGRGHRGHRTGDDPFGALKNNYFLAVCEPGRELALLEELRVVLRRAGGVCTISDCMWVRH